MRILFQGDSITDAGRERAEETLNLGNGYVNLIAARLMCDNPEIEVINRGIAGNRIADMYGRWQEDTLNIDYDVLSIMCGINDVGFDLRLGRGSDVNRFEFIYDRMIYEAMEKHPNSKLIICEPYLMKLKKEEAGNNIDIANHWDMWYNRLMEERVVVKKLAEKYKANFVPFGEMFDEICKTEPAIRFTQDGIHATPAGNEMMARKWLECCTDLLEQLLNKF